MKDCCCPVQEEDSQDLSPSNALLPRGPVVQESAGAGSAGSATACTGAVWQSSRKGGQRAREGSVAWGSKVVRKWHLLEGHNLCVGRASLSESSTSVLVTLHVCKGKVYGEGQAASPQADGTSC